MRGFSVSLLSLACTFFPALGQDAPEPDKAPPGKRVEEPSQPEEVETTPVKAAQSVEELARLARRSAVVIRHGGPEERAAREAVS